MNINQAGLDLVKRNEGCRLDAYQDPVGIWTIGYGDTGGWIKEGVTISQARADELLNYRLGKFCKEVEAVLERDVSENQFSALVSLAYNIGMGNFERSSVLRYINAGKTESAADRFLAWNQAGGKVLPGLTRRREEERELFLTA